MDTPIVGGRHRLDQAALAISTAALLVASAAAAPSVMAQPDTGIDILGSSEGTFTFADIDADSQVRGTFAALGDDDRLPGHPGAFRLDSTNGGTVTFGAIDSCADGGGIDIIGRNLPGDFNIDVVDDRSGANRMYQRAGGTGSVDFIHPAAFPCSPGDGSTPPDRIVGETIGELVAGNPGQCFGSVQFRTILDSSGGTPGVLKRIFGGGAGRDSLDFIDGDSASGLAVYQARTRGYSVISIVQPDGRGVLVEGKPKTLKRGDARSLLRHFLDGDPRQSVLDDITRPAGACAWDTTTDMRQGLTAVNAYVANLFSRHSGAIVAPVDPSRFSGDPVPSDVDLEFTIDGTSPPMPVTPVRPDDEGVFWFTSPDEAGVLLRVLDGCSINGEHWVFSSTPEQFDVDITITDAFSGRTMTWENPTTEGDDPAGITFLDRLGIDCPTP